MIQWSILSSPFYKPKRLILILWWRHQRYHPNSKTLESFLWYIWKRRGILLLLYLEYVHASNVFKPCWWVNLFLLFVASFVKCQEATINLIISIAPEKVFYKDLFPFFKKKDDKTPNYTHYCEHASLCKIDSKHPQYLLNI